MVANLRGPSLLGPHIAYRPMSPHIAPPRVERVNAFCEIRRSRIHGQGVFARRLIRKGVRVLEYVGEKIDKAESTRRGLALLEQAKGSGGPAVFIFDLNETTDIDGGFSWNPARLVNHSCEPNCEMVNEDDRLHLVSLREIRIGEELAFDYGYDLEFFLDHPCRCGARTCCGYIVNTAQRPKLLKRLRQSKKS